jgi:succinate dehydrogenase/fumarate reductase-like Fe-S protein
MEKIIRVTILRENPVIGKGSYPQVYDVQADWDMTVLEILHKIYFHLDSTLAYRRYRCGRRICRSCEIKLDGKIVRGCATLLSPGKIYLLEPAHSSSLIRDLVFEFDR